MDISLWILNPWHHELLSFLIRVDYITLLRIFSENLCLGMDIHEIMDKKVSLRDISCLPEYRCHDRFFLCKIFSK